MGLKLLESFGSDSFDEHWTPGATSLRVDDGPAGYELHPATVAQGSVTSPTLTDTPSNDWVVCWSLRVARDTNHSGFSVRLQSGGVDQVVLQMSAGTLKWHYKLGASRNLPSLQVLHFAWKVSVQPGTAGSASLHVWDGSAWEELLADTGIDTAATGSAAADGVQFWIYNQQRLGNVSVWEGTALPAEPVFCHPQAAGVDLGPNQWTPNDGTNHAATLDDDVNYLSARAAGLTERFGFDVPGDIATGAAVYGLELRALARRAAAAAQPFSLRVWSGAVAASSLTVTPASTNRTPTRFVLQEDPEAAAAWTENTLSLAEVGAISV